MFIIAIGNVATVLWLMALAVFGAGFCAAGGQIGINALAAAYYPTTSRATGVSWAVGIGRLGSVLGSMLGGVLLSPRRQLSTAFAIVAVPALVAGASMLAMGRLRAPSPARPAEAVAAGWGRPTCEAVADRLLGRAA